MNASPKRAHVFWWKDLERWIVPALQHSAKLPDGWSLVRIGDLVKQVTEKVKVEPDNEYKLAGVRWYGEGVFHRETVTGSNSSATYLMPLIPGSFIYNRLFAWKESFAVVPEELNDCLVSNEFPQFRVNSERLLVRYLYLFFMCKSTIKAVNKASIGSAAVSRNRYKEEYFLNVQIPLPPLKTQETIVSRWQAEHSKIVSAGKLLVTLKQRVNDYLHSLTIMEPCERKALVLSWDKLESWDVKSSRASAFKLANPTFKPFGEYAEEATELARPKLEPEKDWPVYGVNNKEGVFFSDYQKGADFNAPYKRIRKDWFFHNPTRSSVGSLGIVPEVPEDAITSPEYQVWRIRNGLQTGFAAVMITTEYFIKLIQFNRVGAVKQRLYVDNLLSIPIPEIPEEFQREVAEEREKALAAIAEARQKVAKAAIEVEAMILGTKKVDYLQL